MSAESFRTKFETFWAKLDPVEKVVIGLGVGIILVTAGVVIVYVPSGLKKVGIESRPPLK